MGKEYWNVGLILCLSIIVIWSALWSSVTKQIPLRIATSPWPGYEFMHLADKKGFFKEERVDVKLVRFKTLEDGRRAYERGQVDGMTCTPIEMLQAYKNGRRSQVLIMTDFSNGADVILAQKEIKSLNGLKGRKIGAEADSLSVFIITRALVKARLSLDDVKIYNINQRDIPAAMLSDEIDAAHSYPPYSTELVKHKNKIIKLFDSAEIPGEIPDVVVLDPEIIAERMEDMKSIRRAWDKAVAYARANPEEANRIMAAVEGISQQEFAQALAGSRILSLSEQRPFLEKDGTFEQMLLQVNELLHLVTSTQEKPLVPADFVAQIKDDQK